MNLTLIFDHRFCRDRDGAIFSQKGYHHALFAQRYLRVFERVRVLARVVEAPDGLRATAPTTGPGVEVVSLGGWGGALGLLRHRGRLQAALRQHLASDDGAVLLIAPGMLGGLALPLLHRAGRPYGVEVVGDPYDIFAPGASAHPLRPLLRWASARQLQAQCGGAAAACYVTRDALQRRYPCPAYAAGVSDVSLPAEAFVAAPRPAHPTKAPLTLIMVGTLAALYKAPGVLIDAVATCVREGLDLRLVFVGDGKHRRELEARAAARGLGGRVDFRGALPAGAAVRAALDAADLFVLPSYQEGLPRAMVEAMARAVPCIGSCVGGIPELLPPENLVAPGDVAALARKIREIVTDPARLARMSAESLAQAAHYQEDQLAERRFAFYRHVAESTQKWQTQRRH